MLEYMEKISVTKMKTFIMIRRILVWLM